jgi:hypothetical protein
VATYSVALPAVALSPTVGPTAGLNTITATSTAPYLNGVTTIGATFVAAATPCAGTYTTTGYFASGTVSKISNFKVAVRVPAGVVLTGGQTLTPYNLCLYNGTSVGTSTLVSNAGNYSVAPVLGVTSVNPAGGPAQGGSEIEVTGTGFPYPAAPGALTANLGGSPIEDIVVTSATTFTGTTTAHASGAVPVSVTTAAGTVAAAAAFTYSNGITIAPTTAPSGDTVFLDIMGVGFSTLTFTAGATNSTDAHVYLVDGEYDQTATTPGSKDNAQIAECTSVLRISDVELICTLDLSGTITAAGVAVPATPVPDGTYTVTVVNNGAVAALANAVTQSIISSGSTFTVSEY